MKKIHKLILGLSILLGTSCSETTLQEQPTEGNMGIYAHAPVLLDEIQDIDLPSTRSALNYNSSTKKYDFLWGADDKLRVFSQSANNNNNMYYVLKEGGGTTTALFQAEGFMLTAGRTYYSFSPYYNSAINPGVAIDKTNFPITYEGQRQMANGSSAHLGHYDYIIAANTVKSEGFVSFDYKRLGTPLRFTLSGLDIAGKNFREFKIFTSDNYDFRYERVIDITDGNADLSEYAPYVAMDPNNPPRVAGENGEPDDAKYSFSMKLGEDGVGIDAPVSDPLLLFMMIPPTNELETKNIYAALVDDHGDEYYLAMPGRRFEANKPISYTRTPAKSGKLNVSLSVNKLWQHGDTQDQTRAGDPGVDDKLIPPSYIYIYTCKDDKLIDIKNLNKNDANWAGWKESGNIWRYDGNVEISLGTGDPQDNVHVYAIASNDPLTLTTSVSPLVLGSSGTAKSVIEAMTLSTTFTQDLLKNLYAYDYKINAGDPPVIDAVLYHSAAKLDVQWNSKTELTGSVSINELPTSGLKLFTPTANTGSGTWAEPVQSINTATMYNGRAVFYVPQLQSAEYSITTGTKNTTSVTQNVTFTPTTSDKKTSWLKANITIQ